MSELLNELKHWRVEGGSVLRDYHDYDHWVHWDDIKDIVNKHEKQPTLNENQQIVLEWLKWSVKDQRESPIDAIYLLGLGEAMDSVSLSHISLTNKQQAKVLQAFASWVEQEEE